MADDQAIINTIKKMLSSEIDEDTIISSLKDIGLSEKRATELLNEAKGNSSQEIESDSDETALPEEDEEEFQAIDQGISDARGKLAAKGEQEELKQSSIHSKLEQHSQKMNDQSDSLGEMHSKINALNKKVSSIDSQSFIELNSKISSMQKQLNEIQKQTTETAATNAALHDLMKKILENQKTLIAKK